MSITHLATACTFGIGRPKRVCEIAMVVLIATITAEQMVLVKEQIYGCART